MLISSEDPQERIELNAEFIANGGLEQTVWGPGPLPYGCQFKNHCCHGALVRKGDGRV